MNMIKNIYDCVKFGKRCDFIFKRISVSKVTGTCIYTLSLIFQKFSRLFELHPLCSAGPRQKHDALIILFFMCPCLFYVDSLFSSISRYSLMLRSMLYCLTILWTIQLYIDIKWISTVQRSCSFIYLWSYFST